MSRFKQKLSIEILHYFPGNFLLTGFGPFLALIREHDFIKKLVFLQFKHCHAQRFFSIKKNKEKWEREKRETKDHNPHKKNNLTFKLQDIFCLTVLY